MRNKKQETCLSNAQNELHKISQMAEQLKTKTEFSEELASINNLQQIIQKADKQIQNAKEIG